MCFLEKLSTALLPYYVTILTVPGFSGRTDKKFTCINNVVLVSGCVAQSCAQKKRNSRHRRRYMRRNLDLDHCPNKQQAVIAVYVEELEENDRKIAEGAWATSLDYRG